MSNGVKTGLKVPYGIRDGRLIHVSEVQRGADCECRCIACNGPLVARKGAVRTHHFSHNSANVTCSVESVLHMLGKRIIRERVERHLKGSESLPLRWRCAKCGSHHEVNMLKKAVEIHEEYDLGTARSDLMLLNSKYKPYLAVEIVVTHSPEEGVRRFYRDNYITCVEFSVATIRDLENLESQMPLMASAVDHCTAPKCTCGGVLFPRSIYVLELPCWKCQKPMKASYGYFGYGPVPPSDFESEEIIYASRAGVKIQKRFSAVVQRSYFMNICPHCDRPWGDNYASVLWENFGSHPSTDVLRWCAKCKNCSPTN